jgi:hypothetical protein
MKQVSPNDTMLTPVECKSLWMEFKEDMKYKMNQARSDQVPCYILLYVFIAPCLLEHFQFLPTSSYAF